jgi:hypothetical protein
MSLDGGVVVLYANDPRGFAVGGIRQQTLDVFVLLLQQDVCPSF